MPYMIGPGGQINRNPLQPGGGSYMVNPVQGGGLGYNPSRPLTPLPMSPFNLTSSENPFADLISSFSTPSPSPVGMEGGPGMGDPNNPGGGFAGPVSNQPASASQIANMGLNVANFAMGLPGSFIGFVMNMVQAIATGQGMPSFGMGPAGDVVGYSTPSGSGPSVGVFGDVAEMMGLDPTGAMLGPETSTDEDIATAIGLAEAADVAEADPSPDIGASGDVGIGGGGVGGGTGSGVGDPGDVGDIGGVGMP